MNMLMAIWNSFLTMPMWVKIWVFIILIPFNLATLMFLGEPGSILIACLAIAGMAFNAIPLWFERAFSTTMAIPHVIFWIPLVAVITYYLTNSDIPLSETYQSFLVVLLAIDVFSLMFDIPDAYKLFKQKQAVS